MIILNILLAFIYFIEAHDIYNSNGEGFVSGYDTIMKRTPFVDGTYWGYINAWLVLILAIAIAFIILSIFLAGKDQKTAGLLKIIVYLVTFVAFAGYYLNVCIYARYQLDSIKSHYRLLATGAFTFIMLVISIISYIKSLKKASDNEEEQADGEEKSSKKSSKIIRIVPIVYILAVLGVSVFLYKACKVCQDYSKNYGEYILGENESRYDLEDQLNSYKNEYIDTEDGLYYCDGKEVKLVSLDGAESVIYESELYADAVLGIHDGFLYISEYRSYISTKKESLKYVIRLNLANGTVEDVMGPEDLEEGYQISVPFIRDNKLYVLSKNYDAYRVEYIDLEKPEFEKKLYLGDVDVSVSATECLLYRFMYDYKYYMEAEELPWNHLILMEGYDTMTQVKDGKWYYLTSDLDSKESSYNRLEFKTDNGSDSASLAKTVSTGVSSFCIHGDTLWYTLYYSMNGESAVGIYKSDLDGNNATLYKEIKVDDPAYCSRIRVGDHHMVLSFASLKEGEQNKDLGSQTISLF